MDHASDQSRPTLYAHKKRREWGRAFLLWEQNEKRGYLFEGGHEKVLARGFYALMEEIEVDEAEYEALKTRLGVTAQGPSRSTSTPNMTFDEQLEVFRLEYPGGFPGARWQEKVRGTGAVRRIKRHRQAAINEAQAKLGKQQLATLLEQQQYRHVWETALGVLAGTDLLPSGVLTKLSTNNADQLRSLAEGLTDLIHGSDPHDTRMDRFCRILKLVFRAPSWQLATACQALVVPTNHFCVRPVSLRDQVKQLAPNLTMERWPSGTQYATLLATMCGLREKLQASGEQPADLFDIYDFVRLTTRSGARAVLAKRTGGTATKSRVPPNPDIDDDTEAA